MQRRVPDNRPRVLMIMGLAASLDAWKPQIHDIMSIPVRRSPLHQPQGLGVNDVKALYAAPALNTAPQRTSYYCQDGAKYCTDPLSRGHSVLGVVPGMYLSSAVRRM